MKVFKYIKFRFEYWKSINDGIFKKYWLKKSDHRAQSLGASVHSDHQTIPHFALLRIGQKMLLILEQISEYLLNIAYSVRAQLSKVKRGLSERYKNTNLVPTSRTDFQNHFEVLLVFGKWVFPQDFRVKRCSAKNVPEQ